MIPQLDTYATETGDYGGGGSGVLTSPWDPNGMSMGGDNASTAASMMPWKDIGRLAIVIAILYIAIEYSPITSFMTDRMGSLAAFADPSHVALIVKAFVLAGTFVGVIKFANI